MAGSQGKGKSGTATAKKPGAAGAASPSMEGATKIDPAKVEERALPKVKNQADFDKYVEAHIADIVDSGNRGQSSVIDIKQVADRMKKHGVDDQQFIKMFSNTAADTDKFRLGQADNPSARAFTINGLSREKIRFENASAFKSNKEIELWNQSTKGKKSGEVINSSANFEKAALQYVRSRSAQEGGLVPIHNIRSAIGDRTTRSEFNNWMLDVQARGKIQLKGGDLPGVTTKQLDNSLAIPGGGVRFYASPN